MRKLLNSLQGILQSSFTYVSLSEPHRDPSLIPELGRSPGERNGNSFQYSCLENPMDRGAWWDRESMGSWRVGHDWVTNTHTHTDTHTHLIGLYTVCRLGITNFILQSGNVVDTIGCLSDILSFHHPNLIANKILNVFKGKIALLQSRYSLFLVLL